MPLSRTPTKEDGSDRTYRLTRYEYYAGVLAGQLCAETNSQANTIITFNYDLLLEHSLDSLGWEYNYASPGAVAVQNQTRTEEAYSDAPLRILKPHGSVNWGIESGNTTRVHGSYSDLLQSGDDLLIMPPTWRKEFGGILDDVWEASILALREATRVIVIGFSFSENDPYLKYLLAAGLQDNISLRQFVLVDPEVEDVEERLFRTLHRKRLGKVYALPLSTSQFLGNAGHLRNINRPIHRSLRMDHAWPRIAGGNAPRPQ